MSLTNDEVARLEEIIGAVNPDKLYGWDKRFFTDISEQYDEKGAELFLTPRQWENLERLYVNA